MLSRIGQNAVKVKGNLETFSLLLYVNSAQIS
jgi:hypothetical protein